MVLEPSWPSRSQVAEEIVVHFVVVVFLIARHLQIVSSMVLAPTVFLHNEVAFFGCRCPSHSLHDLWPGGEMCDLWSNSPLLAPVHNFSKLISNLSRIVVAEFLYYSRIQPDSITDTDKYVVFFLEWKPIWDLEV